MKFKYNYHRDLNTLHIGCEKPRAYFIPYENTDTATEGIRGASARFVNLCGDWNFRYYPSSNNVDGLI